MEKADDLMPNIRESLIQRLGEPTTSDTSSYQHHQQQQDHRLVLQLGSNDPYKVQECVKAAMALEYHQLKEINLNCGCPAIDSGGAPTYGASLMKDPALTASLVEACVRQCQQQQQQQQQKQQVDVSVKCRIGVVDHANDLSSLSSAYDYDRLHHYVSQIQQAGSNHVILHARPAVLAGLSPVKNRIVPTLQYEMVRQIAHDFPNLKVTLNGGITSLSQQKDESSSSSHDYGDSNKISSFMAGRWILQRPLDLIGIEEWLIQESSRTVGGGRDDVTTTTNTNNPDHHDDNDDDDAFTIAKDALEAYLDYCITQSTTTATSTTTTTTASDLCLPLFLVIEQLREDYDYDDDFDDDKTTPPQAVPPAAPMLSYEEMESLYDLLQDGVSELCDCMGKGGKKNKKSSSSSSVNFKRLSSSFKSLVGTKVANKWKRNRAEL